MWINIYFGVVSLLSGVGLYFSVKEKEIYYSIMWGIMLVFALLGLHGK